MHLYQPTYFSKDPKYIIKSNKKIRITYLHYVQLTSKTLRYMILAFQNIVVFPLILSKLILMIIDLQLINLFDDFHFSSRTFILHIHFIQFKQVNFQFFLNLIGFPFTFSLIHKLFKRWEGVTDLIKFFFIIYNDIWRVPVDFNHVDLLLQMLSFIND